MNAMTENRLRSQQSALLVDVCVIARSHVEVMHFFKFFAVLGQMGLQISSESGREFGRATHHFFRAGHGEPRAESIIEQSIFSAMPLAAESFTFQERNGK